MPRVQDVTTSADSYNISSAHILYLSNLLSLFRIIAVPFVFWGLVEQNRWLVFGVGGTAVVTDTLDGLIARKLGQQSDLGRLLDPIGDKLGILSTTLALVVVESAFPLWAFLVVLVRDMVVFGTNLSLFHYTQQIQQSDLLGKITSWLLALSLLLYLLLHWQIGIFPQWIALLGLSAGLGCALVSMGGYIQRLYFTLRH